MILFKSNFINHHFHKVKKIKIKIIVVIKIIIMKIDLVFNIDIFYDPLIFCKNYCFYINKLI